MKTLRLVCLSSRTSSPLLTLLFTFYPRYVRSLHHLGEVGEVTIPYLSTIVEIDEGPAPRASKVSNCHRCIETARILPWIAVWEKASSIATLDNWRSCAR
jgi:hypothetical protein